MQNGFTENSAVVLRKKSGHVIHSHISDMSSRVGGMVACRVRTHFLGWLYKYKYNIWSPRIGIILLLFRLASIGD